MQGHDFRQRLKSGALLFGTLVTLPSPEIAELLGALGYDWLFIDAEHGAFGMDVAQRLLQAAGNCPCVVRVPAAEEVWIKKALDIGAAGIIVPQIESAKQAEEVVRCCKYPPQGRRGVGIGRAHGYGLRFKETLAQANESVAVILQAEREEAVRDIDAIAAIPGVDAVLIGPYDLSASLGVMGQVDHPRVVEAIATVRSACLERGVKLGFFGVSAAAVMPYVQQGFTLIAVGSEATLLIRSARESLKELGHG
jgi:2-dehydro-3-deoxyglucarate aldolase